LFIAAEIYTTIYDTNMKHMQSTKNVKIILLSQYTDKNQTIRLAN